MYGMSNGVVSAMEEKHKSRKWKQHRVRGKGSVRSSLNEKVKSEGYETRNPMLSEGRPWLGEEAVKGRDHVVLVSWHTKGPASC